MRKGNEIQAATIDRSIAPVKSISNTAASPGVNNGIPL